MFGSAIKFALALTFAAFSVFATAQEVAPDVLVKKLSDEVIAAIKQDKDIRAGNAKKIADMVDSKVIPHFNFARMTQIAMGVNWKRATPQQQEQLVGEFRALLVRTYSGALGSYRDQTIDFRPARIQPGDTEVTVKSAVKQPGTQPINIDYQMEKAASGWKIYDVRVGGVSLVTNYRETFTEAVRANGVDGLIDSLSAKNRQNDVKLRAAQT